MDFTRGLLSALVLTMWMASLGWFVFDPSGRSVLLVIAASVAVVGWWFSLPPDDAKRIAKAKNGRGAPRLDRSKNRYFADRD